MRHLLTTVAAAATFALAGTAAHAQTHTVDFTADASGAKPNGYMSPQSGLVTFSAAPGGQLYVGSYSESIGNGIAVFSDDTNSLLMNFLAPMQSMSLVFGNDQYGYLGASGFGRLTLFLDAVQVGQVDVVANQDDLPNQTIGFSGAVFNSATFQYRLSNEQPANLIEVVDNVTFTQAQISNVPEPSTYVLLATGLGTLGVFARRRRQLDS